MKRASQVWPLPFTARATLDFSANAARVDVVPLGPGETARIEAKHQGTGLAITQRGDEVHVRLSDSSLWGASGGAFTVHVPTTLKARIAANMGQARITGLTCCDLEVTTNAGQVQLDDCRGRFVLKAKAGQIIGRRLGGTFEVESGAGEADLDIVHLDPGVHRVHSTMGSVKIDLAPGIDVRIESRTVMGSTRTRYPSRDGAPAVLKLEAELGAVKVREGSKWDDPKRGDWLDWKKVWAERLDQLAAVVAEPPKDDLRRILEMVQQKKITPEEAERLLAVL